MYHQFNIQQSYVLPTQCICVFYVDLKTNKQTAIISLYRINWLVFITETVCVYCAARTKCLYIIPINLTLQKAKTGCHVLFPFNSNFIFHNYLLHSPV